MRPAGDGDFWRMSWVNGTNFFSKRFPQAFRIAQNRGEGIIIHGTRQWTDYQVSGDVMLHLGNYGGMAVRAQGLQRYYGARVTRDGKMQIVRVRDEDTRVLAEADFSTKFETAIAMRVSADGDTIRFEADGIVLTARDASPEALRDGGIGLVVFLVGAFGFMFAIEKTKESSTGVVVLLAFTYIPALTLRG